MSSPRVRCRVDDETVADLVREILEAHLPGIEVEVEAPSGAPDPSLREAVEAAQEALRESRRLLVRGRQAGRALHAANNSLAALLAEAQLLEMEPLPPEQLDAVRRIVGLCRRVAGDLRQVDAVPPSR